MFARYFIGLTFWTTNSAEYSGESHTSFCEMIFRDVNFHALVDVLIPVTLSLFHSSTTSSVPFSRLHAFSLVVMWTCIFQVLHVDVHFLCCGCNTISNNHQLSWVDRVVVDSKKKILSKKFRARSLNARSYRVGWSTGGWSTGKCYFCWNIRT